MAIRATISRHRLAAGAIALLLVGLIAFVLLYFEPQQVFFDDVVDEAVPTVSATPGQSGDARREVVSRGEFRSLEHGASGHALILEVGGSRYLRFEDLDVSNGPDLKVYLSEAPSSAEGDAFVDEGYVKLDDLKGNIGDQNYELPGDLDLDRFKTAVIWCERFGVGFAVAPIT